jgi:putative PEP-CTERM system histidine kinase
VASLGIYSYSIAALAFLLLTALLATGWRGRSQGIRLIGACAVTAGWAALMAAAAVIGEVPVHVIAFGDCMRDGAWIFVLSGLAASAGVATTFARALNAGWILAALYLLIALLTSRAGVSIVVPGVLPIATGIGLALGGLVLVEQVYRNARGEVRYGLKYLAFALGTLWVYDVYLYSQAQWLHAIDVETWNARGLVATLTVPLVALAARRNARWSLDIFVSRQVMFYTTTLIAVGAYLLFMAFGAYAIRLHSGGWGRSMQLVFLAGAGIVLLSLVASGRLRRRLRVFLNKHFYRDKYDYRAEWLRFIDTLTIAEEGADTQETAVRAIAQIFGSPGGVLYLRRDSEERFEATAAWPRGRVDLAQYPPIPVADDLPSFMARRQWVVDAKERASAPDLYDDIVLPAPFGSSELHRIILPLLHGPALLGFVALEEPPSPFQPNYEDRDLLKTVGRHVATHLAQHEADRRLAENRQFEAYHRLTAYVMHDLKNLAAQLALIVENAERHRRNPEFVDDAISTIANSTARMQGLIGLLQRREVQGASQKIALVEVARRAVEHCSTRSPVPVLLASASDVHVDCDPERLSVIVEHVIRNAQDATPGSGSVTLSVEVGGAEASLRPGTRETAVGVIRDNRSSAADEARASAVVGATSRFLSVPRAVLTVSDTGSGMTREFIQERLFRPFDTTKGSKGMGIGAYQVRAYVQSLGGRVEVVSEPGRGTRFMLLLPVAS